MAAAPAAGCTTGSAWHGVRRQDAPPRRRPALSRINSQAISHVAPSISHSCGTFRSLMRQVLFFRPAGPLLLGGEVNPLEVGPEDIRPRLETPYAEPPPFIAEPPRFHRILVKGRHGDALSPGLVEVRHSPNAFATRRRAAPLWPVDR